MWLSLQIFREVQGMQYLLKDCFMCLIAFSKLFCFISNNIFPCVFLNDPESLFLLRVNSKLSSIQEEICVFIYMCA